MTLTLDIARGRIAPPLRGVAWRGGAHRAEVECCTCGKRFERYASAVRPRNYCSQQCRLKSVVGPGNANWRGGIGLKIVSCIQCGADVPQFSTQPQRGRGKFCSIACKAEYQRLYPDHQTMRREGGRRRYTRERAGQAIETHSYTEWLRVLSAAKGRCAICKRRRKKLERDHIIPLSKGGSDAITNIQPVCKSCNCHKHNRRTHLL